MTGSLLDEVVSGESPLREGQRLGTCAARVGFDWDTALQALEKVDEEIAELREELEQHDDADAEYRRRLEDEIGDVLFAIANVARKLGIDAERAMAGTNRKFRRRFASIEAAARRDGVELEQMTLDEMEEIWRGAKS